MGMFDDVRVFGYSFGLDRCPTPWQRGFWIDRVDARRTSIGLGAAILHVARMR